MKKLLNLKSGTAVVAILFVLAGGLAYALTEVVRDVDTSVTVKLKVPDGIEVYSDAGLTNRTTLLDFGLVQADVFGTVSEPPTIDVWVKNLSNSVVELRLEDDFDIGEVLFGFEGREPLPSSRLSIVMEPEQVLQGEVGLRLTRGVEGRHDFTTSFIATGPILLPTPTPTRRPTATPHPTATRRPTVTATPAQPTATPHPAATPTLTRPPVVRPGKRGGRPPTSTNVEITHFGIHECAGSDNTCLAHPAPNYNGLIEYNPETDDISDIRCDLCTDWDLADDGVTYTFKLHPDARWNNGTRVTAQDVVFSLDRMVDPTKFHVKTRAIGPFYKSSRVIDEKTVAVLTKFPAPAFFPFLASEYMKVLSKHHVQSVPDEDMKPFEHIMGSGPFKLIQAERGVKLEYVRNQDYFKEGLPYFEAMTLFFIIDRGALYAAFRAQQILFTIHPNSGLSNSDALRLAEQIKDKARFIFVGPIAPLGIFLNVNRAPFDDPRVRHALWLATHRRPYVETFSSGVDLLGGPFSQ